MITIDGIDVIAAIQARVIQRTAGEPLVEKAGLASVLAGGLGGDPVNEVGCIDGLKQSSEKFQMQSFSLEGERQMSVQRWLDAIGGREGLIDHAIDFDILAPTVNQADDLQGLARSDLVAFGKPAIAQKVVHFCLQNC